MQILITNPAEKTEYVKFVNFYKIIQFHFKYLVQSSQSVSKDSLNGKRGRRNTIDVENSKVGIWPDNFKINGRGCRTKINQTAVLLSIKRAFRKSGKNPDLGLNNFG